MARFILLSLAIVNFVAPVRAQDPPPAVSSGPVDGSLRANFDGRRLQALLVREGYSFLKLTRDRKTSKLFAMCEAEGTPVRLLIDTSTNRTLVSAEIAKRLGLKITGTDTVASRGGELQKIQMGRIEALKVGQLTEPATVVSIVEDSALRAVAEKEGQLVHDGILAADWLADHSCVLDLGNGILFYRDPSQPSKTNLDLPIGVRAARSRMGTFLSQNGFKRLNVVHDTKTAELFAICTVNGRNLHLLVDTGATLDIIAEETAIDLKMTTTPTGYRVMTAGGEMRNVKLAQVADIKWGDRDLDTPQGTFLVMDYSAQRRQSRGNGGIVMDGILGIYVLSLTSAVIDFRHDLLHSFPPLPKQFALLTGKWQATQVVRDGEMESKEKTKEWKASFEKNRMQLQDDQNVRQCNYSITLAYPQCRIDLVEKPSSGVQKVNRIFGIYEFDDGGNKLTMCISLDQNESSRPTTMESKKDSKTMLIEFERVTEKQEVPQRKRPFLP
jgi:uncharacterized protein (TIGR03067 family)